MRILLGCMEATLPSDDSHHQTCTLITFTNTARPTSFLLLLSYLSGSNLFGFTPGPCHLLPESRPHLLQPDVILVSSPTLSLPGSASGLCRNLELLSQPLCGRG